ncbi:uncharacterized protein G2W53_036935 [Senna tora]|uniref:Uncharacterized protein n=1 Tax=Senna tora TaxID=362788 RepID=A0A834SUZ7_9FABA|nr:uncharacterized protein G2W53_036935 [Senna tora]
MANIGRLKLTMIGDRKDRKWYGLKQDNDENF